jgi:ATP-dependent Clp protease ATP-binding subunit ClpC
MITETYLRRALRSALSISIALSILVTVQLPAAAQLGQAARVPAGRSLPTPPALPSSAMRLAPLGGASLSASLDGTVSAPALAPRLSVLENAPAAPSALSVAPAALLAAPAEAPEAPKEGAKPAAPRESEGGPRWVQPAGAPAPAEGDNGPRWVDPKKAPAPSKPAAPSTLRSVIARFLPFVGHGERFDGSSARKELGEGVAAKASSAARARLARHSHSHSHRHDVVQDLSIPTPEAVKRVASDGGPRWVKYFAPIAIIGATVFVFQASIVPAAIVSGALMLSVLAHESAHILGLRIWGDKTPALAGRDSINPLKHISLLGTILVPAASLMVSMAAIGFPVLFGWAKPVPVDFNNLKNPKTDAAKVAALGPLTNLGLAAAAGLLYLAFPAAGIASTALLTLFKMNLALTAFNLLPLPFLDGGKILVSMLPKSWYARWTHDPHLPMGYQRFYKAIYEGPANLLSKLHVHAFDHVNGLTRLASLAALGAFYAAFFTVLQVPLMFLALPCSYDYWCIREKVRSEAAVKDLMSIMSEWSAVIVQIAEDKGLDSEVSAYETEHAMKNALETLIDELMAKEDFKALSDEEKIERLMREYPDKAADFLKDKAMTEDSKEKILEVLADPRNAPYNERLRRWLKDHDIFKRWDNKHEQGKLKESMKEADKKRAAGGPGGAALGAVIGLLSLGAIESVVPGLIPHAGAAMAALGFAGMLGSIVNVEGGGEAPRPAQLSVSPQFEAGRLEVSFFAPLSAEEYGRFLGTVQSEGGYGLEAARRADGSVDSVRITYRDAATAAEKALAFRVHPQAIRVDLSAEAFALAEPSPANATWQDKVRAGLSDSGKLVVVIKAGHEYASGEIVSAVAGERAIERRSPRAIEVRASSLEDAAEIARALAGEERVDRVVVSASVSERLTGAPQQGELDFARRRRLPVPTPVTPPTDGTGNSAWRGKLRAVPDMGRGELKVSLLAAHSPRELAELLRELTGHGWTAAGPRLRRSDGAGNGTATRHASGRILDIELPNARAAAELAAALARDARVGQVSLSAGTRSVAVTGREEASNEPAAEPVVPQEETRAAEPQADGDAAPAPAASWQEKVYAGGSTDETSVSVDFGPAADVAVIETLLASVAPGLTVETPGSSFFRRVIAGDAARADAVARALAETAAVTAVWVAPAAYARLTGRTPVPAEAEAPAPRPEPTLPNKVTAHGKEEWSTGLVKARFSENLAPEALEALLRDTGSAGVLVGEKDVDFNGTDLAGAIVLAKRLAERGDVASVEVHPNAAATILEKELPYASAQAYDHERALLVEFPSAQTQEQALAYAETRRLRLVHNDFRGREGMALYEVPASADLARTYKALALEDGSPAKAVRPMRERAGLESIERPAPAAAPAAEEAAPVDLPRRDPHQAWIEYLQNLVLNDGKSNLTDKQIQLLSTFLKPVAKPKGEERAPVVSRNEQVKEILPIVTSPRGMRNSVVIIGEAGVGKTAVAEGLAELMEDMEAGGENSFLKLDRLKGRWLVELDINKVLTTDDPVGLLGAILDLLPRMNKGDASRGNDIIVLMDEIQKFFLDPSGVKIANTLKGPLRDGKISVIATTTRKEFKEHIEKDDAFRRRFHKVEVEETNVEQTISILRALKAFFQRLHTAKIPDETLVASAKLSHQFDKTNYNPDKAIKLVQDSAELSRPENLRAAVALDLRETWNQLVTAANEARQLLIDKGIASTLALPIEAYNQIAGLIEKAEALQAEAESIADGEGNVTVDVAKRALAIRTGIASGQLNLGEEDAARYNTMEDEVEQRVVNQRRAITAIANAVRRNKAGLSNPGQPMGKFLFVGPTGVGKTYLAKELARFLFKDPEAMVRFDMSEFQEPHSVARLIGSPPGYVGHGAGGQLTEAVRKKPYSVILLDEVEKAHPDVFNVLLQILDDGRLTDGEGRTVDFKNTVIIMTSNLGMRDVDGEKFSAEAEKAATPEARAAIEAKWDQAIDEAVAFNAKQFFRPEFLNRLDEDPLSKQKWVRVNRLRAQDAELIAKLQVKEFEKVLEDRHGTALKVDPSFIKFMMVEGFSPLYGARPMKAAVEKYLVDPLAQWILKEASEGRSDVRGGLIEVGYQDGKVTFRATPRPAKETPRASIKGASETVAAQVFKLIEQLAGEGEGDEPSEALFDKMMRGARAESSAQAAPAQAAEKAERKNAFLTPGARLSLKGDAVAAEHNNAKKKDGAMRGLIAASRESAAKAGWPAEVQDLLDAPAGTVGEGWLKQLVRLSKEMASKNGAAAPVSVTARYSEDAVQIAVSGAYALSEDDQKSLLMHFSGAAPKSYLEAQQKADQLNLTARLLWDHNLLDLYRRLSALPGARMGFATGPEGTQLWLEIRKPKAEPAPAAKLQAPSDAPKATPHQNRQMEKVRGLLMKVVDQDRLREHERDGHAIRIAAAEGWARLSVEADLAAARSWLKDRKLADSDTPDGMIKSNWPLVMTAALVIEKFGGAEDIALLETIANRFTSSSHFEVPAHNALTQALAALYARAGLSATRAAMTRAAQLSSGNSADIKNATHRAFGAVGMPIDEEYAKRDADGLLELYRRQERLPELVAELHDKAAWRKADEPRKMAILKAAGESETSEAAVQRLREAMGEHSSYSRTGYETSRAIAAVLAHAGMTDKLGDAIKRWLDQHGVSYSGSGGSKWTQLLAYVELARLSGGAETLDALEQLMRNAPDSINSVHEQAYFTSPDAWARSLIRGGKFEEYARPTLGADGAPGPSKLEQMLASKDKPMLVAGALRAIAYARDPSFKPKAWAPAGAVPDIAPVGSGSSSSWEHGGWPADAPRYRGGPSLADWKNEMFEHRFGHRWRGGLPPY